MDCGSTILLGYHFTSVSIHISLVAKPVHLLLCSCLYYSFHLHTIDDIPRSYDAKKEGKELGMKQVWQCRLCFKLLLLWTMVAHYNWWLTYYACDNQLQRGMTDQRMHTPRDLLSWINNLLKVMTFWGLAAC